MSHIAVERNRRRQMNEYLKGDQASIIGGVIEFIKELEQVLEALEWKKRRKSLSPSYSPRTACSKNFEVDHHHSPPLKEAEAGGASCNSEVADVEVKISGPNVILRVITHKIPGQVSNIITILETLSFQVLHLNISSMQDTVLYHFVLKIGLECQLSLEELAMGVQQSFCSDADLALN
ncbi:transcription factor MUTE [Senna tora]|uniref:Transcription factor MUTE n=1 Tax=Senna tora TaxID=362788 RepID=A0A834WC66_9FABA|nr:transcription factor MUTE [Senna tora]